MGKVLLTCGHTDNAIRKVGEDWVPSCAICGATEQVAPVNLEGRQMRCYCGNKSIRPSDPEKGAFFEYRGEGSPAATKSCKCGYYISVHHKENVARKCPYDTPVPKGPFEYDSYYCGCRGWD